MPRPAAQIAEAAVHASDGNFAQVASGGSPAGLQEYKTTELTAVVDTADDFVFDYRRPGDVPGELY